MADCMEESVAVRCDLMALRSTRNLLPAGITAALFRLPWYLQGCLHAHQLNFAVDVGRDFFPTAVEHIKRDLTEQSKERNVGTARASLYKKIRFMDVSRQDADGKKRLDHVRVITLDGMVVAVLFHVQHGQPELVSNLKSGSILSGLWQSETGTLTVSARDIVRQLQNPHELGIDPGHAMAVLLTCNAMHVFDFCLAGGIDVSHTCDPAEVGGGSSAPPAGGAGSSPPLGGAGEVLVPPDGAAWGDEVAGGSSPMTTTTEGDVTEPDAPKPPTVPAPEPVPVREPVLPVREPDAEPVPTFAEIVAGGKAD